MANKNMFKIKTLKKFMITRRVVSKGPIEQLPLSYFLLRAQALKLYRQILKEIKQIQREDTRLEIKQQAKDQFLQYKDNRDVEKGRRALAEGHSQLKELRQIIYMSQ